MLAAARLFHTDPDATAQALWDRLSASGLPKLWIPKREDLRHVASIPTLGTGKIDLRAVRALADEHAFDRTECGHSRPAPREEQT